MPYTEANYENAIIEVFRDTLGYHTIYAADRRAFGAVERVTSAGGGNTAKVGGDWV